MKWYFEVLNKYCAFGGRAGRKEFWVFTLVTTVISYGLVLLCAATPSMIGLVAGLLAIAYGLATFLPTLAVIVRRLHDTNRSGWWYFINLVPMIGQIVLLVFLVQDSYPETNRFGPNPKFLVNPP